MKNIIIAIALFLLCISKANSQEYTSIDSVLLLIKTKPLFKALDGVHIKEEDHEKLYNSFEFKNFLLKRLDQNAYFEYHMKEIDTLFINEMKNVEYAKSGVKSYLNGIKKEKMFDSIVANPELFKKYKDTLFSLDYKLNREGKDPKKYYPPTGWVRYFPYPEAHKIIKEWWLKEQDPSDGTINWTKEGFFDTLLFMNDPDAQELLIKKIDEFIKTNGESEIPSKIYNLLKINNSYSLKQLLRLLTVTTDFERMSSVIPFNCQVIYDLVGTLRGDGYKFPEGTTEIDVRIGKKNTHLPYCENRFNNLSLIKKYLEEYSIKLDKKQEYWMKNMSFNNKK